MLALRRRAEALEGAQVATARRQGWSWQEIAAALEVSEQAVHQEHAVRVPARARRGTEEVWVFERSTREAREVVRRARLESREPVPIT